MSEALQVFVMRYAGINATDILAHLSLRIRLENNDTLLRKTGRFLGKGSQKGIVVLKDKIQKPLDPRQVIGR